MTALLVVETALLVVLTVLVIGLLRAYATILNRLHSLENGAGSEPFRTISDVPSPPSRAAHIEGREEWAAAHDIDGVGLDASIVSVRVVGVEHDTVLIFLSSSCAGCVGFWSDLARDWPALDAVRVLVVAKGPAEESPASLAGLCPPGVDLVQSGSAWVDYAVPGSPYVVLVDGRTGRIAGEGSGTSLAQVLDLVAQTDADRNSAVGRAAGAQRRGRSDQADEIDRALQGAGIGPGDPRLYGALAPDAQPSTREQVG